MDDNPYKSPEVNRQQSQATLGVARRLVMYAFGLLSVVSIPFAILFGSLGLYAWIAGAGFFEMMIYLVPFVIGLAPPALCWLCAYAGKQPNERKNNAAANNASATFKR